MAIFWKSKSFRCLAYSPFICIFGNALGEPIAQPSITFNYDSRLEELDIRVKNEADGFVHFFDSLSGKRMPFFLSVRIQDRASVILSNSELSADGFVSSNIFSSDAFFSPVPISLLQPGHELRTTVPLKTILQGTSRYLNVDISKLKNYCLVFRLKIYLDVDLLKSTTQISSPFCN